MNTIRPTAAPRRDREAAQIVMNACHPGRTRDAAEPEHGMRLTSGLNPIREASRASMVGTATPVLDTITMASTSSGGHAPLRAPTARLARPGPRRPRRRRVRLGEPGQLGVPGQGWREATGVHPARAREAHELRPADLGQHARDLVLVVAVRVSATAVPAMWGAPVR